MEKMRFQTVLFRRLEKTRKFGWLIARCRGEDDITFVLRKKNVIRSFMIYAPHH
jgi:hypothetical protein